MTVLDLPIFEYPDETLIWFVPEKKGKVIPVFLYPDCASGGGSSGPCEDDRPDTGMLYPRG